MSIDDQELMIMAMFDTAKQELRKVEQEIEAWLKENETSAPHRLALLTPGMMVVIMNEASIQFGKAVVDGEPYDKDFFIGAAARGLRMAKFIRDTFSEIKEGL